MKVKRIISKSKSEERMEVIAGDSGGLYTLHIRKSRKNKWFYDIHSGRTNTPTLEEIAL